MRKKKLYEKQLKHYIMQQLKQCPTEKRNKLVAHNQECKKKKKNEGYMHFFSRHETCLSILTTISCNFQFVKTHTHTYIV